MYIKYQYTDFFKEFFLKRIFFLNNFINNYNDGAILNYCICKWYIWVVDKFFFLKWILIRK